MGWAADSSRECRAVAIQEARLTSLVNLIEYMRRCGRCRRKLAPGVETGAPNKSGRSTIRAKRFLAGGLRFFLSPLSLRRALDRRMGRKEF
jgi:hypothetical protein